MKKVDWLKFLGAVLISWGVRFGCLYLSHPPVDVWIAVYGPDLFISAGMFLLNPRKVIAQAIDQAERFEVEKSEQIK